MINLLEQHNVGDIPISWKQELFHVKYLRNLYIKWKPVYFKLKKVIFFSSGNVPPYEQWVKFRLHIMASFWIGRCGGDLHWRNSPDTFCQAVRINSHTVLCGFRQVPAMTLFSQHTEFLAIHKGNMRSQLRDIHPNNWPVNLRNMKVIRSSLEKKSGNQLSDPRGTSGGMTTKCVWENKWYSEILNRFEGKKTKEQ